jgi:hypothetical protein
LNPMSSYDDMRRILWYKGEAERLSNQLLRHIEVLRNQITSTSRKRPFFLYFNWRRMSEREYYSLILAVMWILHNRSITSSLDELSDHIFRDLLEDIYRNISRFRQTKFSEIFIQYILLLGTFETNGSKYPPIREWKGNYSISLADWLVNNFTLRLDTPRKAKRQEFIRGYRDHGSKASDSEVARRQASESSSALRIDSDILSWEAQIKRLGFSFLSREEREERRKRQEE